MTEPELRLLQQHPSPWHQSAEHSCPQRDTLSNFKSTKKRNPKFKPRGNLLSIWFESRINSCVIAPRIQTKPQSSFLLTHQKSSCGAGVELPRQNLCPLPKQQHIFLTGTAWAHAQGSTAKPGQLLPYFPKEKSKINTHLSVCQNRQYRTDLSSFKVLKAFYKDSKTKERGVGGGSYIKFRLPFQLSGGIKILSYPAFFSIKLQRTLLLYKPEFPKGP